MSLVHDLNKGLLFILSTEVPHLFLTAFTSLLASHSPLISICHILKSLYERQIQELEMAVQESKERAEHIEPFVS